MFELFRKLTKSELDHLRKLMARWSTDIAEWEDPTPEDEENLIPWVLIYQLLTYGITENFTIRGGCGCNVRARLRTATISEIVVESGVCYEIIEFAENKFGKNVRYYFVEFLEDKEHRRYYKDDQWYQGYRIYIIGETGTELIYNICGSNDFYAPPEEYHTIGGLIRELYRALLDKRSMESTKNEQLLGTSKLKTDEELKTQAKAQVLEKFVES